jgi:hypothetical protein
MPWSKALTVLVDCTHNNFITPTDPDFTDFFQTLRARNFTILSLQSQKMTSEELSKVQVVILGVSQNSYILQEDVQLFLDYVRGGGSLLLIHRYGGDLVQKTDLNELSKMFGIYFENTLVRSTTNAGIDSLPLITVEPTNPILKGINKLIFAGSCSLRTAKDAKPLITTMAKSWIELYNPHNYTWIKEEVQEIYTLAAFATYGQGRVMAIGSPDIFSNKTTFGINLLDNRKFAQNILSWLAQPVSDSEVRDWMLTQIGSMTEEISHISVMMQKIQNSIQTIEHRINDLEHKYYASKGIHLPSEGDSI